MVQDLGQRYHSNMIELLLAGLEEVRVEAWTEEGM